MDVVNVEQARIAGGWRRRRHGPRARPGRHPQGRWRRAHVRPHHDQGDQGGGHHPRHGQGAHRPFVEAQVLESIDIDYIDESEVLTPADEINHINKHNFKVPVLCGCRDLGEALRRIAEGSSMIRTKGEAGTGNVVEAVRHCRAVMGDIADSSPWTTTRSSSTPRRSAPPRARQADQDPRPPPRRQLCRGRPPPRGCRAHDAARHGRRLSLRHLQVGRSRQAREGHRPGGDPLQRPQDHRGGVPGLGEAMVGIDCKEMHFTSYAARSE